MRTNNWLVGVEEAGNRMTEVERGWKKEVWRVREGEWGGAGDGVDCRSQSCERPSAPWLEPRKTRAPSNQTPRGGGVTAKPGGEGGGARVGRPRVAGVPRLQD